jgi:hypothetical protein
MNPHAIVALLYDAVYEADAKPLKVDAFEHLRNRVITIADDINRTTEPAHGHAERLHKLTGG